MRRRFFLSPHRFFVIVLHILILVTERDGVVKSECPPSSKIKNNLNIAVGYLPSDSEPKNYINSLKLLTHINYVESNPENLQHPDSSSIGKWADFKKNGKLLVSIPLSNPEWKDVWKNSTFLDNLKTYVEHHNLDGVDLEHPLICDNNYQGFATLITNLRGKLDSSKLLTLTLRPQILLSERLIRVKDFESNITFTNVMAFQLNVQLNTVGLSSPYSNQEKNYPTVLQSLASVQNSTIVLGVDFGGTLEKVNINENIDFTKAYENRNSLRRLSYNASDGAKPLNDSNNYCPAQVPDNINNIFSWSLRDMIKHSVLLDLCNANNNKGWTRVFDNNAKEPYLYKNDGGIIPVTERQSSEYLFVSYDDPESLYQKIDWVLNNNYGGIAIADLSRDTENNDMLSRITSFFENTPGDPILPTNPSTQPNPTQYNPSTSPSPSPFTSPDSSNNLSAGAIAGIVISISASLVLFSLIGFFLVKKKILQPSEKQLTDQRSGLMEKPIIKPTFVTALYDFEGRQESDLSFKKGDRIEVIERGNGPIDWWVGRVNGVIGEFPGNYVRIDS